MDPAKTQRDLEILDTFVGVYCRRKHRTEAGALCDDCRELLEYARDRRTNCPLDPKPKCKDCPVHCYRQPYRDKIRQIMKFSGIHFVKRGRVDWLVRYFLSRR